MTDEELDLSVKPADWQHSECQCARCGSSMYPTECSACGGDGVTAPGELHEQDPLWYDEDDFETCHQCGGDGSWLLCASGFDYCLLHPMPGRIEIKPHSVEWFTLESKNAV